MHQAIQKRSIHPQNNFTVLQGHLSKRGYSEKEINLSIVKISEEKEEKLLLNEIEEKTKFKNPNVMVSP